MSGKAPASKTVTARVARKAMTRKTAACPGVARKTVEAAHVNATAVEATATMKATAAVEATAAAVEAAAAPTTTSAKCGRIVRNA